MIQRQTKSILRAVAAAVLSYGLAAGGVHPQTRPRVTGQTSAAPQQQSRASVQLRATLAGHKKEITQIAFSLGGETLATASEDHTIRLWDATTGEAKAVLRGAEKYRLSGVYWSPDGLRLAAESYRGRLNDIEMRIWDARTGELKAAFDPRHASWLSDFEWSPDGRLLLTASGDGFVKLWDAETGRLKHNLAQEPRGPNETDSFWKALFSRKELTSLRFTEGSFDATGQSVLTYSSNGPQRLWDAASGQLKIELPRVWLSQDRRFLVRHDDGEVTLLDAATGQVSRTLGRLGSRIDLSPDGRTLLVVPDESRLSARGREVMMKLYDVETGRLRLIFEGVPKAVSDFYWSPDGSHVLVVCGVKSEPRVLDTRTGRVTARLPYGGCTPDTLWGSGGCEGYYFSADGRVVFKQKNPLKLWSAETGELLATLEEAKGRAVFSPTDKHLLVTRGKDKRTALLWEVSVK